MAGPLDELLTPPDAPADPYGDSFFHEHDPTPAIPTTQQERVNRFRAEDLHTRGIPTFRNASGDISAITDESGAALSGYDPRHDIAYDSKGAPKLISYGEKGPPQLKDAFADLPARTDPDTGYIEKRGHGLYQYLGQDPAIEAANIRDAKDKSIKAESALLGRKLTLDEHDLTAGKHEHDALKKELQAQVPTLLDPKYDGADLATVKKGIDEHFNAEYATPEANSTVGWFGDELSPDAQARRAEIDKRKAGAYDSAQNYFGLKDRLAELHYTVSIAREQERAQVETLLAHQRGEEGPLDVAAREAAAPQPPQLYPPQQDWSRMLGGDDAVAAMHDTIRKGNIPAETAPAVLAATHDLQDARKKAAEVKESDPTLYEQYSNVVAHIAHGLTAGLAEITKGAYAEPGLSTIIDPLQQSGLLASWIGSKFTGETPKQYRERTRNLTDQATGATDKLVGLDGLDDRLKDSLGSKVGNFIGGIAPYVAAAWATKGKSVATPLMASMFYTSGYQRTFDDAKAHGATDEKADLAGIGVGAINAVLALPLRTVGKAAEAIFGDTAPKVIERAITNAYEGGGAEGVYRILSSMAQNIKAGGLGTGAKVEVHEALTNLMAELTKTPAQRLATVAKTAATHAALGAGVQTSENLLKKTYNPEQGTFEGVKEQAIGFGVLGGLSEGFKQVADARKAKQALDLINKRGGGGAPPATPQLGPGGQPPSAGPAGEKPANARVVSTTPTKGATNEPGTIQQRENVQVAPTGGEPSSAGKPPAKSSDAGGASAQPVNADAQTAADQQARRTKVEPGDTLKDGDKSFTVVAHDQGNVVVVPTDQPGASRMSFTTATLEKRLANNELAHIKASPTVDAGAHQAATSTENALPEPSQAQKEAGNYQKGHVQVGGLDVSIENPAGSRRQPEFQPLQSHYGYIKGTVGADKDHIDIFIKQGTPKDYEGPVFVVNQHNKAGQFDEHKAVIGVADVDQAKKEYLGNYEKGWTGGKSVVQFDSVGEFKKWATSGAKGQPVSQAVASITPPEGSGRPKAQVEGVEHIVSTAVKQGNKWLTGSKWNTAHEGIGMFHGLDEVKQSDRGFIVQDKNGEQRFVPRSEAGAIAQAAGQASGPISDKGIQSADLQRATPKDQSAVVSLVHGTMAKHLDALETLGHGREPTIGKTDSASGIQAKENARGKPVITIDPKKILEETAALDPKARSKFIQRAVEEEILHVAALKWDKQSPENAQRVKDWGGEKDELADHLSRSYDGWEGLNDWQKGHEKLRAVLQKRWTGKLTEAAYRVIREFLKYLRGIYEKLTPGQRSIVDEVEALIKGETKKAPAETKTAPRGTQAAKSETNRHGVFTAEAEQSAFRTGITKKRPASLPTTEFRVLQTDKGWISAIGYQFAGNGYGEPLSIHSPTFGTRGQAALGALNRLEEQLTKQAARSDTSAKDKKEISQALKWVGEQKAKEKTNATSPGEKPSGSQPEHQGISPGPDVRSDQTEVRQKNSGQTSGSGGADERAPTPEVKPGAGQPEKASLLDAGTKAEVRSAFDGLFAASPVTKRGASYEGRTRELQRTGIPFEDTGAGQYLWHGIPSGDTSRARATGLQEWLDKQAAQRDTTVAELAAAKPEIFGDLVKGFDRKYLAAGNPRLRHGEKQGDIFSGGTEELTLQGESGVDWGERQKQADIAENERIAAQLKQDEAQGSLFAATPQLALPAEKLAQFVSLAQKLVTAGVDTPEKLAAELKSIFAEDIGKVRPYSQALWDAIGMVKPELRATHDWPTAYGDSHESLGKVRPRRAPAPDGGFTDHPFIQAIMGEFGGIMSKSVAKKKLGERFAANASLWDGAPKLADPRHTKIYDPNSGQTPDAVAQGLADMGMLRDGDVDALWRTILQISDSSKRIERQEREQKQEQNQLEKAAGDERRPTPMKPNGQKPDRSFYLQGDGKFVKFKQADDSAIPFTLASAEWQAKWPELDERPTLEDPWSEFNDPQVGDMVRLLQPTLHGPKPQTGTIWTIKPDGQLEIRMQLGGIVTVDPSELLPSESKSGNIELDDTGGSDDLEPDSELAAADEPGGEDSVSPGSGTTRTPGTLLDDPAGGPENAATSGPLSADVPAAPHRASSDLLFPEPAPAAPERAPGSPEPTGSSQPRDSGLSADTDRTKIAGESLVVAPLSPGVGVVSQSGGAELDAIQRAAPALTPEQAEDVRFIEARLHEQGKAGVLLTNGTGTGKTFSGMGEVKMMLERGAKNILVVVPSDKIGSDWVDTAHRFFGVKDAAQLPSTFDNGKDRRLVVTTYANFGQNNALVNRPWDLIVADESHYLSSSAEGDTTLALEALRALAWHPQGLYRRTQMLEPEAHDAIRTLRMYERRFKKLTNEQQNQRVKLQAQLDATEKKVRAEMTTKAERDRPKVLFMSATPFAYRKSVDYANGFLFDYAPQNTSGAYNTPSPFGQFMIENFGYRMRTGKLTEPENATATGILERRFAERLMREKSMRGRALVVPHDYSRDFVLTESQLGAKVDLIISKMMGSARLRVLEKHIGVTDYLQRRFLLESLKAREAIPRIRKHLALGRKLVVFHDYKLGGAMNPLQSPVGGIATYTDESGERRTVSYGQAYQELRSHFPDWDTVAAELSGLRSPISYFTEAFGAEQLGIFNGGVSKRQRREIVKAFNDPKGKMRVLLAQRASAKEGISLHDIDGTHQRAFIDLGIPGRPTDAIQSEGRIYRHGVKSNAIDEYLVTGTNFERWTFAQTIAQRASTAENLAMGEGARALLQSFSTGFNDASAFEPHAGQGVGGKQMDEVRERGNPYRNSIALYYTNEKKTARSKSREGVDYFPTPEPIGFKMVEWADVKPGEKVLEPSAGHGAIARFFPDSTNRHAVEPSNELAGRLALNAPDTEIHNQRFEDFNVVNKFDAVIMNPPFGTAGKTAMEHVEKAAKHLRDSGRLVALLPSSTGMDKRLNDWLDSEDVAGKFHLRAKIFLPSVAFERAGTGINSQVIVIDKSELPLTDLGEMIIPDLRQIDNVKELFDRLEHKSIPARPEKPAEPEPQPERDPKTVIKGEGYNPDAEADRQALSPEDKALTAEELEKLRQERIDKYDLDKFPQPTKDSDFTPADFTHTKTGDAIYVAKTARFMSKDEFAAARARAKQLGGYYSSFKGAGAVPGFHFKTPEARDAFLGGTANEALGAARPFKAITAVYKDDVERVAREIGMTAKEAFKMLQHLVSPTTGVAMQAHDRVMKMLGERNQKAYETDRVLEVARKAFDKMERKDQVDFIDRMKLGKDQATPELQAVADTMRKIDTESWDAAHAAYIALGFKNSEVPLSWKENHYRVLWKVIPGDTPQAKAAWIGKSRRGLRGSMGQHRQSTLDDMSEGLQMGGEPYSYNPVIMFKLAQADLWKLTTTLKTWKWAKDAGFVDFVPGPFPKLPDGMVWLDDSIANVYFPAASGEGLVQGGKYAVEAGFGRLLNNYLSVDVIRRTKTGRGLLWIKNATTMLELSLSMFHGMFETAEVIGSNIGLGLNKLVNRGLLKGDLSAAAGGIRDMITAAYSPIEGYSLGRQIRIAAADPQAYFQTAAGKKMLKTYPRAREFIDDLFTAGWKPTELEQDWKNNSIRTFLDSLADVRSGTSDNYIGAGLRAFPAANEMLMKPLFDYYIPSLKVAQFFKEYAEAIEQNERKLKGGILTRAALARQVWRFVEDRFGELNYDTLFWNSNFKTAMQLMFRSVTWKLGSVEAFAGAFGGQAKEFRDAFQERRAPELHRNTAWIFGMFLLTATLGYIISKTLGGKDPKNLTDYVFPQIDPKDDKVRVSLPTYFKDMVHLIHAPVGYVTSSMSGWIGRVMDLLRNKDYYGVQIRDKDDPITKQALAVGKYAGATLLPFSVRGYKNLSDQDVNTLRKMLAGLGINPAPRFISQSVAEQKAEEYWKGRQTEAGVSPEQFEAKRDKSKLVKQIRHGESPDISGALTSGALKPKDVKPLYQRAQMGALASQVLHMPLPDAEKVFRSATQKERVELAGIMARKRANSAVQGRRAFSGF